MYLHLLQLLPRLEPTDLQNVKLETFFGIREVIRVVFEIVWSIEIELLLVGDNDFGPFGFPANMVHRSTDSFTTVVSFAVDSHIQPFEGSITLN